jgi:hypothetical protein
VGIHLQHLSVESVVDCGNEVSSTYTIFTFGFRIVKYKAIDKKLIAQLPNMMVNTNLCQKPSSSDDKNHESDIIMISTSINKK